MARRKTLNMVMMIILFISLILYDYRLHKELKVKTSNLNNIKQYKSETKSKEKNEEKEKIKYSYVLKEIHRLNTLEINEMLIENNDGIKHAKFQLCYIKALEEFINDENIKSFFAKNKDFTIKSVVLKENKVIISMECVLG